MTQVEALKKSEEVSHKGARSLLLFIGSENRSSKVLALPQLMDSSLLGIELKTGSLKCNSKP